MENSALCTTHAMLTLLLTTDPDLFGLDEPGTGPGHGGGWCCFLHICNPSGERHKCAERIVA
jgi:hypothetical protein